MGEQAAILTSAQRRSLLRGRPLARLTRVTKVANAADWLLSKKSLSDTEIELSFRNYYGGAIGCPAHEGQSRGDKPGGMI